jgi:hypothetical protein
VGKRSLHSCLRYGIVGILQSQKYKKGQAQRVSSRVNHCSGWYTSKVGAQLWQSGASKPLWGGGDGWWIEVFAALLGETQIWRKYPQCPEKVLAKSAYPIHRWVRYLKHFVKSHNKSMKPTAWISWCWVWCYLPSQIAHPPPLEIADSGATLKSALK